MSARPPANPVDNSLSITVGAGVVRPKGRRMDLPLDRLPDALVSYFLVNPKANGVEAWFALHEYTGAHRKGDNWKSASGIGCDLDYYNSAGKHSPVPESVWPLALLALTGSDLPGDHYLCTFAYPTPNGLRAVSLFDKRETNPLAWEAAARALGHAIEHRLREVGFLATTDARGRVTGAGLLLDWKAQVDRARCFFCPGATAKGVKRSAFISHSRFEPWSIKEILALSPDGTRGESPAPAPIVAPAPTPGCSSSIVFPDDLAEVLVKAWPPPGHRHDTAMALAGLLARRGVPEFSAGELVYNVATEAGDEEEEDRCAAVAATYTLYHAGHPTTGLPALRTLIGAETADKLDSLVRQIEEF